MCMFEKVILKEKEIMRREKVKLLRVTRTAEGGRTFGTIGIGYKVVQPCRAGFQTYLFSSTVLYSHSCVNCLRSCGSLNVANSL